MRRQLTLRGMTQTASLGLVVVVCGCAAFGPKNVANPEYITLDQAFDATAKGLGKFAESLGEEKLRLGMHVCKIQVVFNVSATAAQGGNVKVTLAPPTSVANASVSGEQDNTSNGTRGNTITIELDGNRVVAGNTTYCAPQTSPATAASGKTTTANSPTPASPATPASPVPPTQQHSGKSLVRPEALALANFNAARDRPILSNVADDPCKSHEFKVAPDGSGTDKGCDDPCKSHEFKVAPDGSGTDSGCKGPPSNEFKVPDLDSGAKKPE